MTVVLIKGLFPSLTLMAYPHRHGSHLHGCIQNSYKIHDGAIPFRDGTRIYQTFMAYPLDLLCGKDFVFQ